MAPPRRRERSRVVGVSPEFDADGAAPQPIEAVEVARVLREDVDHEVEVVEQHPLGARVAFDERRPLLLRLERLFHRIGNGLHLPRIGARADHEEVRERARLAQVEHDHVGGLLVARRLNHGLDGLGQARRRPPSTVDRGFRGLVSLPCKLPSNSRLWGVDTGDDRECRFRRPAEPGRRWARRARRAGGSRWTRRRAWRLRSE